MKKSILIFHIAVSASWYASAETLERCPVISEISKEGIWYTATAVPNDAEGMWLGVAPDDDDRIKRFTSATFYPAKDSDSGPPALVNCSYELRNGRHADLRFVPRPPRPTLGVDESMWRRKNGPYGRSYYECTAVAGSGCSFYLARRSNKP
ncbi:DUF3757 domain-containing protein [Paraburkholderia guartelaensis]|uniref:DUF3757 domain-containing protein n=1 Tax=Paraburkholderia guartelaensis TaxID=2546446 RepID=A0A4R5KLR4_9BURK|nr:DUF3757 domain-containing protein [Paraburkholderia guartelaensis]